MGIFHWIPVIPVESGSIPADSSAIPVDSTRMTRFCRNDVGHQKVLADDNIDFLSPFGLVTLWSILVNQHDKEDGAYNCSDLLAEYPPSNKDPCINESPATNIRPATSVSHVDMTLDGDLKDAMFHELQQGPISSDVIIEERR